MDGNTAVYAALGATVAIQIGGIAFFAGSMAQKLADLKRSFERHQNQAASKAHGIEK